MSEAYFPDDLRLRTYAGLSETLRSRLEKLGITLRRTVG